MFDDEYRGGKRQTAAKAGYLRAMAQRFAMGSKREAQAFLAHDILGPRLIECTRLVMAASEKRISDILDFGWH